MIKRISNSLPAGGELIVNLNAKENIPAVQKKQKIINIDAFLKKDTENLEEEECLNDIIKYITKDEKVFAQALEAYKDKACQQRSIKTPTPKNRKALALRRLSLKES